MTTTEASAQVPAEATERPKRKRRTKAEIEADAAKAAPAPAVVITGQTGVVAEESPLVAPASAPTVPHTFWQTSDLAGHEETPFYQSLAGGLVVCRTCSLAEAALTTDCCGSPTGNRGEEIRAGILDYRAADGWVKAQSPHSLAGKYIPPAPAPEPPVAIEPPAPAAPAPATAPQIAATIGRCLGCGAEKPLASLINYGTQVNGQTIFPPDNLYCGLACLKAKQSPPAASPTSAEPPIPVVDAVIVDSPPAPNMAVALAPETTPEDSLATAIKQVAEAAGASLAVIKATSDTLVTQADALTVTTPEDVAAGVELAKQVKATDNTRETERKRFSAPLNTAFKAINALFKPVETALAGARDKIDEKILAYNKRVAAEAAALAQAQQDRFATMSLAEAFALADACDDIDEARRIRAAALERQSLLQGAPAYVPPPVTAPGFQIKDVWTSELASGGRELSTPQAIADLQALCHAIAYGLVPPDLVSIDWAAVQRLVHAGHRTIPGLRVFQDQQTAVSA